MSRTTTASRTTAGPQRVPTAWVELLRGHATLTRQMDAALRELHGLNLNEYEVMLQLGNAEDGRLRRVDLAERLGLTASGVTRTLLPLEKIGLVTRETDPRDARVGFAVVTPTGEELLTNATDVVDSVSRDALRGAEADQLAALSVLLGQVAGINPSNP